MTVKNILLAKDQEIDLTDVNFNEDITNLYILGLLLTNSNYIASAYVIPLLTLGFLYSNYGPLLGFCSQ
jgi:hypothetical protein